MVLLPEIVRINAGLDVRPGQYLVPAAFTQGVVIRIQSGFGEGIHPELEIEMLAPAVQPRALVLPQPMVGHQVDLLGAHAFPHKTDDPVRFAA